MANLIYTIISQSEVKHHLRGYTYKVEDQYGDINTFYGSEFEDFGIEPKVGLKFEYHLDKFDQQTVKIID